MGGALKAPVKVCPQVAAKAKALCWIGAPSKAKSGRRLGAVDLPNPESRPSWAAFAMFSATVTRDSVLEKLEIKTNGTRELSAIESSITGRFGLPTSKPVRTPTMFSATWDKPEIHVKLLCSIGEFCVVDIMSPAARDELARELEQRSKRETARPQTL